MQKNFISIHKPPVSIRFAPINYALAVTVEPFKFTPAEPVAYELSQPILLGGDLRTCRPDASLDPIAIDDPG